MREDKTEKEEDEKEKKKEKELKKKWKGTGKKEDIRITTIFSILSPTHCF